MVNRIVGEDLFNEAQGVQDNQADPCGKQGRDEIPGADGQAETGGQPEARGGGQAPHRAFAGNDGAGPEKTHAGDGIGGDPGGVQADHRLVHGQVPVDFLHFQRQHHHEAGAHGDQDEGPEARGLAVSLPFKADGRPHQAGEQQPGQLPGNVLPVNTWWTPLPAGGLDPRRGQIGLGR